MFRWNFDFGSGHLKSAKAIRHLLTCCKMRITIHQSNRSSISSSERVPVLLFQFLQCEGTAEIGKLSHMAQWRMEERRKVIYLYWSLEDAKQYRTGMFYFPTYIGCCRKHSILIIPPPSVLILHWIYYISLTAFTEWICYLKVKRRELSRPFLCIKLTESVAERVYHTCKIDEFDHIRSTWFKVITGMGLIMCSCMDLKHLPVMSFLGNVFMRTLGNCIS